MTKRRALLSVSDKTGIVELARGLHQLGWELIATRGTCRLLVECGVPATAAGELLDWEEEAFAGRVKTLHPLVFSGLLYRRGVAEDEEVMRRRGLPAFDLLASTLYPFEEARRQGAGLEQALAHIDVGGAAMVRAAAKNFPSVLPLVDPGDYGTVLAQLREARGDPAGVPLRERQRLAVKAFTATRDHDTAIVDFLSRWAPTAEV
jgi:phosphoribosylaminoimidazolecarboxamide formyltransferase/IMP cyclohydrolase